MLYSYEDGVQRVIGYDQDRDDPVEVFKILKVFPQQERLNHLLNTFNAYKELTHSPYFVDYLGYNVTDDPDYNLFFTQLIKSRTLDLIVGQSLYRVGTNMLIF